MDTKKLKINIYLVPFVLILFMLIVVGVFLEHVIYFRQSLARAFEDPPQPEQIIIDTNTLAVIAKDINIDPESIALIPIKTRK